MFKLLFSAVAGGGPMEWAALALGAVLLLGGTFAAGALWESTRVATAQAEVLAHVAGDAAKAQHDRDVKAVDDAKTASDLATARAQASDAAYAVLAASLKHLPRVTVGTPPATDPHLCDYTPEALDILNKAGH